MPNQAYYTINELLDLIDGSNGKACASGLHLFYPLDAGERNTHLGLVNHVDSLCRR